MGQKNQARVLFVCLGNICRSPAAEAVFKAKAFAHGLHPMVDSAGTSAWHHGEKADARMSQAATKRGYNITSTSRPFNRNDFDNFDLIVAMDNHNFDDLKDLAHTTEEEAKIVKMADFLSRHQMDHIPDPYYGGSDGFNLVIDLLEDASEGLLKKLI
ncbi:MAG TPA: low molecular weight protein-tyrosine-phosphatase [Bacteroidales bacterium]|nr:low molecular weight protein-tyrosine-phosphatase [Bacteroidales bacterium]HQQ11523.1 low molecular weight protein-tyrosine-phosphatase [Bacteroidales bacterium]